MSKSNDQFSNQSSSSPQQAERIMQEHLAEIIHEIRTPASAIIGWSELLLMGQCGPLNEKQREIVTEINKKERHLWGAFHEIVDMYCLTLGLPELDIAEVDSDQLFHDTIANTWEHWLIQDRSVRSDIIRQDIPSTLPRVWVDSSRIQQAIAGILAEAIRTVHNDDESEIVFTASCDDTWITLQVIITGEGRYYHLQSDGPRVFFCRSIVEMHGGQLSLEQQNESQIEVTLILPISQLAHG